MLILAVDGASMASAGTSLEVSRSEALVPVPGLDDAKDELGIMPFGTPS